MSTGSDGVGVSLDYMHSCQSGRQALEGPKVQIMLLRIVSDADLLLFQQFIEESEFPCCCNGRCCDGLVDKSIYYCYRYMYDGSNLPS